jgi:predicted O-methyltransferase YrrM
MTQPAFDTEFAAVLSQVQPIEGWLRDEQAQRLWSAARRLHDGDRIVEIGSFRGRSTVVLAKGAPPGVELIAIDPHAGNDTAPMHWTGTAAEGEADYQHFRANLGDAGVLERITHVRRRSGDALAEVEGRFELLYIDGAHGYKPAVADVVEWGDRVAPGGTMFIHDAYLSVGVTGALARRLFFGHEFRYVGRSRSLVEYERVQVHRRAYLSNVGRQLKPLPWFVRNVTLRVLLVLKLRRVARWLGYDGIGLC